MKSSEIFALVLAMVILAIVISFRDLVLPDFSGVGFAFLFAFIIIAINTIGKKITASRLDAHVEHSILGWLHWGMKPHHHFKKPIPVGLLIPLIISAFSLGTAKVMTILSYDTSALKRRAAKRHGYMSFTEMTDMHNALIGAGGIILTLISSIIFYFIPGLEYLARLSIFYAFWNILPISKLDGAQIFFGSRLLWATLAIITLIFSAFALLIP